jgi:hypothetical protein
MNILQAKRGVDGRQNGFCWVSLVYQFVRQLASRQVSHGAHLAKNDMRLDPVLHN